MKMMDKRKKHSSQGFTLLEVIVALVVFASVGMTAFSWINSLFIGVRRSVEVNDHGEHVANALELLKEVNPMIDPRGEIETDHYLLSWNVKEYLPAVNQERGLYVVGVYSIVADLVWKQNGEHYTFSFLQNGFLPQAQQQ
jgi:general secretion pathway protein I